jgi:D-alanine-D-alanine ligase
MKKKIALVAGGYSGEYDISIKTAATIAQHINPELYDVYTIVIDRQHWCYTAIDGTRYEINRHDFSLPLPDMVIRFDAVFIAIHGTPGEDGKFQGYLEMLQIPFTSCSAIVSGLTFNKIFCNRVVAQSGLVHVARSVHIIKDYHPDLHQILDGLTLPVFVKPAEGGSSLATTKVKEASQFKAAIDAVFAIEPQAMAEEFINGREFSLGVYRIQGNLIALPLTEIISTKEFFDYEAKYTPGLTNEVTPAEVEQPISTFIEQTAKSIYTLLNCRGICRIDFILEEETGKLYFLEINTIPGQSENSIVPQQVRADGMTLMAFYGSLIEECLR